MNAAPPSASREDLDRLPVGLVDAETGIISRVACGGADGSPNGLPACAVAALRRSGTKEVGFGKGLTCREAITGAIGEALEIYAGSSFHTEDLFYSALVNLPSGAFDPRLLCLYEEASYQRPRFPYSRFDHALPVHWACAHWLDNNEEVLVPALTVFHYFPAPTPERFCQVTSNGSAAGSSLEDASSRATLELVERDAFMLAWFSQTPATQILLDEDLHPGLEAILDQIRSRGGRVTLYLLNAGVAIPTVLAVARGDGKRWPGATLGLGTHPDARVAIRKAILEMGQTAFSLCRSLTTREEQVPAEPRNVRTFRQHALYYLSAVRAQELDFLHATGESIRISQLHYPDAFPLTSLVASLSDAGIRVAIVDLTTSDLKPLGFSVVRALGTNMQQIHCGYGMERTANPRLQSLLRGRPVNPAIPPFC